MHRPYSRLLILDEPANHLIESRAALIEAINDYRRAVILASQTSIYSTAAPKYVLERAGSGNGRRLREFSLPPKKNGYALVAISTPRAEE